MVTYRECIAIVQVAFYVPALIGGIFLALHHGFAKSSGWVLLITFSLLRLIGAILEIVGIDHPTKQVITGAIVCISIGLSPLTLMCLGLMSRVNQAVGEPISSKIYKGINLVGLIAFCLGIYGGTKQASSTAADYTHVNNDSKAAVVLFTAIFIVAFFMFLSLVTRLSVVPHGEKRLLLAVGLSWPFLTVRYIYALVADFAHNKHFNSYFGNPTIYLLMAVLTECIVIVICEVMGFTLRSIPKGEPLRTSDTEMHDSHMPVNSGAYSHEENVPLSNGPTIPTLMPKRLPKGPISWLYFQAKEHFQSHD
ncbi:hypothetical protein B7463_g9421, partial [Scytalidium lignicola]